MRFKILVSYSKEKIVKQQSNPIYDPMHSFPVNKPMHWNRAEKNIWKLRNTSGFANIYIERLQEIIDIGYEILSRQIAGGKISVQNEASLQLHFAYILKTIGELYQFSSDDLFTIELESRLLFSNQLIKSKSKSARIDIVLTLGDYMNFATAAIELKFFKQKNHREPNNRYDVFKDLHNLENYKKENIFDIAMFILATDHKHYVEKEDYSSFTSHFDFRNGSNYVAGTILSYDTEKPYGEPIILENNYSFLWNTITCKFQKKKDDDLYFLKISV